MFRIHISTGLNCIYKRFIGVPYFVKVVGVFGGTEKDHSSGRKGIVWLKPKHTYLSLLYIRKQRPKTVSCKTDTLSRDIVVHTLQTRKSTDTS